MERQAGLRGTLAVFAVLAAGCGQTTSAGDAGDGGKSGGPAASGGRTDSAGAGTGGGGAPSAGRVVHSDKDPSCVEFRAPDELAVVISGEDEELECDTNGDAPTVCYRQVDLVGYHYDTEGFSFWINFEPNFAQVPRTDQSLREHFRWFWYEFEVPAPEGGEPFRPDRIYVDDLGETEVFSFEDGRLRVRARSRVEMVRRWIAPSGNCLDGDVGPLLCACEYAVSIPVAMDLDLRFTDP